MAPNDRQAALLAHYRTQPPAVRRAMAERASPQLRAHLARVERGIAMDASPGAMAAVLTERREMQARHLHLIDQAWIDMAEGRADRVMITMPPRHGKSRRASLPDGAICVIQTRWNEDDLAGRILADAQANEWHVIDLPALADSDDDPLGRKPGEPLWPERFDVEHHATTRRRVGERVWAALYQQKPRPPEGGVWQRAWITDHRLTTVEFGGLDMARVIVAVDPAGGESSVGDETGIIGAARGFDGHLYVLEDRSASMGANDWGLTACRLALALKADAIVVESNYGGDMARQVLSQAWEQLRRDGTTAGQLMPRVLEVTAKVGKRLRAEPIAQLYEQGLIHHVGTHVRLEEQMATWVVGMDSPDRMDAAVHGLTELADPEQLAAVAGHIHDDRLGGRR
ncbi:terminase, large subunit [Actinacidiphila oryziradicis]|uniref:Terminase, large subunit n=1 Tax=Actinacidiphila oryziradicis TaxID=2571141 RepID=A0A4U0S6V3_9ACTN|nr:terminase, large subunit [Actinacidiphila oryziradicis]TKA04846.1 terminase, large subunit [Actinacidiphila oryziradicis]